MMRNGVKKTIICTLAIFALGLGFGFVSERLQGNGQTGNLSMASTNTPFTPEVLEASVSDHGDCADCKDMFLRVKFPTTPYYFGSNVMVDWSRLNPWTYCVNFYFRQ